VTITLLAFLSLVMGAGLRVGTQIWNKSQGANIDTNAIRAAQKTIAQDLARIYPRLVTASASDAWIDFAGGAHEMAFLSAASRPQMTRVTIGTANGSDGLTLQYDATPELAQAGQETQSQILLRNLKSLDFAYFGANANETVPAWHDTCTTSTDCRCWCAFARPRRAHRPPGASWSFAPRSPPMSAAPSTR